jgi:hypothetical protein
MADSLVSRIVYRNLLRASKRLDTRIDFLRATSKMASANREVVKLRRFMPVFDEPRTIAFATVQEAVKASVRHSLDASAPVDLDMGLQALRRISDRVVELSAEEWQPKPEEVRLDIGDIFRHKRHGYRGVVVAW